jgi:hypothetical protein
MFCAPEKNHGNSVDHFTNTNLGRYRYITPLGLCLLCAGEDSAVLGYDVVATGKELLTYPASLLPPSGLKQSWPVNM